MVCFDPFCLLIISFLYSVKEHTNVYYDDYHINLLVFHAISWHFIRTASSVGFVGSFFPSCLALLYTKQHSNDQSITTRISCLQWYHASRKLHFDIYSSPFVKDIFPVYPLHKIALRAEGLRALWYIRRLNPM